VILKHSKTKWIELNDKGLRLLIDYPTIQQAEKLKELMFEMAFINPEIAGNVRIKDGKLTTDRILECKTANQYLAKLWGDEQTESVPDYYLTQCPLKI
jgi:hypothetical protein